MPAEPEPDGRLAGPARVDTSVNAPAPEGPLPDGYLDLYKLAVEMADRISARRGLTNSFFLTINTAVVGVLGTQSSRWYFAVAGITLSVAWWASLVSYRISTCQVQGHHQNGAKAAKADLRGGVDAAVIASRPAVSVAA